MKFVVMLAVCFGAVLARPGIVQQDDLAAAEKTDPAPNPPYKSIWDTLFDNVDINLLSVGKLDNNPAIESGINGKTYHKFSVGFDKSTYNIYIDHILDAFEENDGGTLGLGFDAPLPESYGDISVRAAQSFNSASNGSMDWRIDIGHEIVRTTTTTKAPKT